MVDGPMLPCSSYKGNENVSVDSAAEENLLLKDLDSYWDDLNARLTVSRMVSDSVVKGMVNAIAQEAAENVSSRESEVAKLNARLQLYESNAVTNYKPELVSMQLRPKSQVQSSCSDCSTGNIGHLQSLKIAVEKHLQMLKNEIESMRSSSSCKMTNSNYENFGVIKQGDDVGPLTKMDRDVDALGILVTNMCVHIGDVISSLNDSLYEQQWQWKFEKEVDTFIVENLVRELRMGFEMKLDEQNGLFDVQNKHRLKKVDEMKLDEQNGLFDVQNKHRLKKVDELSSLRQELESISKSILSTESEHSSTHGSHETFEEWDNTKGKDNFPHRGLENNLVTDTSHLEKNGFASVEKSEITIPEVVDSSLILCMSKEDIINHYKTEINNVKRQLESSLHEKTEELFRLKREFFKEKGSLQCRKEKDFEVLKKTFLEIIVKLDKILFEIEKCSIVQVDHGETCSYKRRIDDLLLENRHLHDLVVEKRKEVKCLSSWVSDAASQMSNYSSTVDHGETCSYKRRIDDLLLENRHLHDLVVEKRKEVKCLSSWVSDAASQMSNYSSTETNLLKKIKKFKWEIEDVKTEAFIKNQIEKCILREVISEFKYQLEDFHMRNEMVEEFYGIMLRERTLNLEVEKEKKLKQVASLSTLINEKESALLLEVKNSEKFQQEIVSLLVLVEENNKIASEAESKLRQQKEDFDKVLEELHLLKDKAYEQEKLISDDRQKSKLLKVRLDEALEQIHQYEAKVCELTQKCMTVSNDLEEAHKQKAILHEIIQVKESEMFSVAAKSAEQMEQMESIVMFVQELSKSVAEFQSSIMGSIQRRNSRLETLCCRFDSLAKQVGILRRRELWYREKFEIRSFDLKKAETEVDLLGDEVDALLDILGKIYVALDYYSPVLQHYHGVMEILKLVRRELKGAF